MAATFITVTAADGTTTEAEGISLGEFHAGVETFLVVTPSNTIAVYRQPTAAAAQAATAADAPEEAAEATAQAEWRFDPNTGAPLVTAPPAPVNPAPVA